MGKQKKGGVFMGVWLKSGKRNRGAVGIFVNRFSDFFGTKISRTMLNFVKLHKIKGFWGIKF